VPDATRPYHLGISPLSRIPEVVSGIGLCAALVSVLSQPVPLP